MKNADITNSNPLTDEVEVDHDVLGALMLNGVGGHVHGAGVVVVYQDNAAKRSMKLLEKLSQLSQPGRLGNGAILSFRTGV